MKRILTGATIIVAGIAALPGSPAWADTEPVKVYVCKYVITPDGQEILQTGDNPIYVSESAIPGNQNTTPVKVGDRFNDAQGPSIVIQIGGADPGIAACPGYIAPNTTEAPTTTMAPTTTEVGSSGPTTTQVGSAGPTTTAQASAGPTTPPFQSPSQLPSTGSSSWGLAMMALAALLAGMGLIKQARRPA